MNKKLLSIGSVVLLKEANKRVMVIGYYPTVLANGNEITYDYSGCLFPEGVMDSKTAMLFNHSDIDKLFYYGLMDEEQNDFITHLTNIVNEKIENTSAISTSSPNTNTENSVINDLELPLSQNS